jgi:hypothetical protein
VRVGTAAKAADASAAERGSGCLDPAPSAAIASRSFRRWPTIVTPRSFKSSASQGREDVALDRVVSERRFVLPETEVLEPGRDVHGRLHSAKWDHLLRFVVCKASTVSDAGRRSIERDRRVPPTTAFRAYRPFMGSILKGS